MAGTENVETSVDYKAVVVDTVALAEQQGTCVVVVSAVDAHQGQGQALAYQTSVACDQELAQEWER